MSDLKPRNPIRRMSDKAKAKGGRAWNSTFVASGKPMKKQNPERVAKRRKAYKAYLNSAAWKKLRLAVFERDGFRCVASVPYDALTMEARPGDGAFLGSMRCRYVDESRTGRGLIADHLTYARFGHENLEDLRTLCTSCNAKSTKSDRANWMNGSRS